jgi:hypothetical protein
MSVLLYLYPKLLGYSFILLVKVLLVVVYEVDEILKRLAILESVIPVIKVLNATFVDGSSQSKSGNVTLIR